MSVVAVGDGLVAGAVPTGSPGESTGGWIAGLGDCLQEGAPGKFSVVDRARPGETAKSASEVVADARAMKPGIVVIGVGAQEVVAGASSETFATDLSSLIASLQGTAPEQSRILLVGVVPAVVTEDQAAVDQRAEGWNLAIAAASEQAGVRHVDLWKDWPRTGAERASLTADGWRLTDGGHARVAAAVCDAVLSWKDGNQETP